MIHIKISREQNLDFLEESLKSLEAILGLFNCLVFGLLTNFS